MERIYQTSAGAVFRLTAHFVWCPKYRRPVLTENVAKRLNTVIRSVCEENEWEIITMEIMSDHVHLLISYDPKSSAARVMNQIKGNSSRILRDEFPKLKSRLPTLWSRSYFVSSIGIDREVIERYINTQYERPWRKQ